MEPSDGLEAFEKLIDESDHSAMANAQRAWIARARADLADAERVRTARVKRRDRSQPRANPDDVMLDWALSTESAAWARRARSLLRRAGHKRGAAREALIKLFAGQECALSIPEVEEKLEHRRPVGRASIYRALEALTDLDLLVRLDAGDGVARYERAHDHDGDDHHHHHLICDTCGLLIPFDDDRLEVAIHELSDRLGFETKGHEVTLRGTCEECKDGAPD